MGRRLLVVALVAASLGTVAPSASARCDPNATPTGPITCPVTCLIARLAGALCKDAS